MDRHLQIRSFVLIADKGSFAAAAAADAVTAAVMGRRLTALEERLGVKLMHRSTRRLKLTGMGEQFLERCRILLRDFEEIERSVSQNQRTVGGNLTVSAPAGFGRRHVAPHVPGFLARHPGVHVSLNLTDDLVDLVREKIDLAVRIGAIGDSNHVAVKLHSNRRAVCGTPEYFRRFGRPRTPEDLLRYNCLTLTSRSGQQRGWTFRDGDRVATVRVSGNLGCNDGELLYQWVRQSLGLGWRSTWEIHPAVARGELITVLDEFALPEYDVQAVYAEQRFLPAKVRAFIEYLKAQYRLPGYWEKE